MNETQKIENYLCGAMAPEDVLFMQAELLVNDELQQKIFFQQQVYDLVRERGRIHLRQEILKAEARLFTEKKFENFRLRIMNIFNRP